MIYMIEKIKMKDGYLSTVKPGKIASGFLAVLKVDERGRESRNMKARFEDIEIGDYVMVASDIFNYIKTSKILEITQLEENVYSIETETSIYELRAFEDSEGLDRFLSFRSTRGFGGL